MTEHLSDNPEFIEGCECAICKLHRETITLAMCGAKPMPKDDPTGCPHTNQDSGFGLAGGGYGVYMYCTECGYITSKTQTD